LPVIAASVGGLFHFERNVAYWPVAHFAATHHFGRFQSEDRVIGRRLVDS
jgi:hypothetical protein